MEAPLAGSSSLQQHGQSRHGVTPAVTRAGNAARSLRKRRANDSAHLAEIATDGTLSELQRLGLYTKALLPDVVHQTNKAESVVEYACATTNVQMYSVGEKIEVIPNTFKEATTLPAKAHWKAASDEEVASLKKNNVYTLVPATAVPAGHKIVGSRWVYKVKADKSYKGRVVVLGWGQVPGVDYGGTFAPVCRLQSIRMVLAIAAEFDLECWQLDYNTAFLNAKVEEDVYVKMAPGYEEFSNNGVPMVLRLLKRLYGLRQSPRCRYGTVDKHVVEIGFKSLKSDPCVYITGSVMCLGQVTRYDIGYVVNQLARAMCKPSKAHMAAAKHLLWYLAGTTNFAITYKRGGLKLTAFSDANWGKNPDNGKSISSCIAFLSDDPVSFKVGLQGLTAQSTMEAELVAAALTMKETTFCSNMMKGLEFGMRFDNVPVYIDNTSTLHVTGNQTYSPRVKHVASRFFFV